jgi:uncharacterized phiE125 gp8 family phage protein
VATRVVSNPTAEPITLAEAKANLRYDASDEDAGITALIVAAREAAENYCERSFAVKDYEVTLDSFPSAIRLSFPPILTVASVKYVDTSGVLVTMDPTAYAVDVDSEPGWVLPAYGTQWPQTLEVANAVRVRYTAGQCPDGVKQAIRMMVAHWFENRGDADKGGGFPVGALALLNQARVYG